MTCDSVSSVLYLRVQAGLVEQADTRGLKLLARKSVPVQVRYPVQKRCSIEEDIDIYREFYRLHKAAFAKWEKGRPAPSWWEAVDINE